MRYGVSLGPVGLIYVAGRWLVALSPIAATTFTVFLVSAARAGERAPEQAPTRNSTSNPRLRVLMICAHEPTMDPRIGWEAEGAAPFFDVSVLGFNREDGSQPGHEEAGGFDIVRLRRSDLPAIRYFWWLKDLAPRWARIALAIAAIVTYPLAAVLEIVGRIGFYGARFLRRLRRPGRPSGEAGISGGATGRSLWNPERIHFVLGNLRMQFGPAAELFYRYVAAMPIKPDVIHCNDLDTLLVGVLAKQRFGCRVVYDAHEFWPVADSMCTWIDTTFFSVLERHLIHRADAVVTVNPMLAEAMRDAYGLSQVYSVPNVEPWAENRPALRTKSAIADLAGDRVKFLFQGRFTKARGVEEIIAAWSQVDGEKAALFLRGPDNMWRQAAMDMAAERGLLGRSVYFLDAVAEVELVAAAAEADVGIVPYLPIAINERLACPNKLSQYLHAGLMVVTNNLPYVRAVIDEAGAGIWYDSADLSTLSHAVNRIAADREMLRRYQQNGFAFARENYNWQHHGSLFLDFYARAGHGPMPSWELRGAEPASPPVDFTPRPASTIT